PKPKSKSKSKGSTHTNKWVLADWAVAEGVQSTTRYRNQVYARRTPGKRARTAASDLARASSSSSSSSASSSCVLDQSAKKAISGRKGGCATKAARQRTQRLRACRPGRTLYESPQQTLDLERAHPSAYGYGDAIPMSYPLALHHHEPYQEVPATGCGNVLESSQHMSFGGGGGGGGFSGPGFAHFSGNSDGNSSQNWGPQAFQLVSLYPETGMPLSLFGPDTGANAWLPSLSQQAFGIPGDDTQAASSVPVAGSDFGAWNGRTA
ncbi:hypothetical protein E4U60_005876, partial [Claviceps pazoutovae]